LCGIASTESPRRIASRHGASTSKRNRSANAIRRDRLSFSTATASSRSIIRRSAHRLNPAIKSGAPRGNSAMASPTGISARRAALRNMCRVQPSNATSGNIASIRRSVSRSA
jgi:hypothetical protein